MKKFSVALALLGCLGLIPVKAGADIVVAKINTNYLSIAVCGDTVIGPGESCDDGNKTGGDGCGPTCLLEYQANTGLNASATVVSVCGNGSVESGEGCDDGNEVSGDGCSANCKIEPKTNVNINLALATCPNGAKEQGEDCDDGNDNPGDGCSPTCKFEWIYSICGNGSLNPGEGCDDGNTAGGDGCSATCTLEINIDTSKPAACGNGALESGEACDDGNTANSDGCDAGCAFENLPLSPKNPPAANGSAKVTTPNIGSAVSADRATPSSAAGNCGLQVSAQRTSGFFVSGGMVLTLVFLLGLKRRRGNGKVLAG